MEFDSYRHVSAGQSLDQVEVAGIEPASFVACTGLLRVQRCIDFLGPSSHAGKLLTGPVTV